MVVTIDNTMLPTPKQFTFADDIQPFIADNCTSCHSEGSFYPGIPVYYYATNPTLYLNVLERLDLNYPPSSPLLLKPTHLQHGGGKKIDRSTEHGEQNYQTILSWIIEGAPCGNDRTFCKNIDRDRQ